jgi:hypothetical protein
MILPYLHFPRSHLPLRQSPQNKPRKVNSIHLICSDNYAAFHTESKKDESSSETRQRRRVKMKQAARNLYQQPCTYDPNRLSLVNPDIYEV